MGIELVELREVLDEKRPSSSKSIFDTAAGPWNVTELDVTEVGRAGRDVLADRDRAQLPLQELLDEKRPSSSKSIFDTAAGPWNVTELDVTEVGRAGRDVLADRDVLDVLEEAQLLEEPLREVLDEGRAQGELDVTFAGARALE